jgi:uncharacterized membrane protein
VEISTNEGRSFLASGVVLGVALSGFFDGILLHQILQWHHLLSLAPGPAYRDPRMQIAADGVFHALMYGLAVLGIVMLWSGRDRRRANDLALWRSVALGFGGWNILDAVLFHWILQWHHIRLDTATPIAWDVMWLVVFGALPTAAALIARGRGHTGPRRGGTRRGGTRAFLVLLVCAAGIWAMAAPKGDGTVVLFRRMTGVEMMQAIASADARLVSTDTTGQLFVVELPAGSLGWRLYRHGALFVSSAAPTGCASWAKLS